MRQTHKAVSAGIIDSGTLFEAKMKSVALLVCELIAQRKCDRRHLAAMVAKSFNINNNTAKGWLKTQAVRDLIDERLASVQAKIGVNADKVLEELMEIAYSDAKNYFQEDNDGGISPKAITRMGKESRAVKRITHRQKVRRDKDGGTETENVYEYEMWDKLGALRTLAEIKKITAGDGDSTASQSVYIMLPDNGFGGRHIQARQANFVEVSDATRTGN